MAVSGLPETCENHAKWIAKLALDMLDMAKCVQMGTEPVVSIHIDIHFRIAHFSYGFIRIGRLYCISSLHMVDSRLINNIHSAHVSTTWKKKIFGEKKMVFLHCKTSFHGGKWNIENPLWKITFQSLRKVLQVQYLFIGFMGRVWITLNSGHIEPIFVKLTKPFEYIFNPFIYY